jgi:hypothetical protein
VGCGLLPQVARFPPLYGALLIAAIACIARCVFVDSQAHVEQMAKHTSVPVTAPESNHCINVYIDAQRLTATHCDTLSR